MALKRLGRDGRKLELWRRWVDAPPPPSSSLDTIGGASKGRKFGPQKQWTEDAHPLPSEQAPAPDHRLVEDTGVNTDKIPLEHIASALRSHGTDILQSFMFPDSRAQFLEMMARVGLLPELEATNDALGAEMTDFWSYSCNLGSLSTLGG